MCTKSRPPGLSQQAMFLSSACARQGSNTLNLRVTVNQAFDLCDSRGTASQAGTLLYLVVLHVLKHLNGNNPLKFLLGVELDNVFRDDSLHRRTATQRGSTTDLTVIKRKDCWRLHAAP